MARYCSGTLKIVKALKFCQQTTLWTPVVVSLSAVLDHGGACCLWVRPPPLCFMRYEFILGSVLGFDASPAFFTYMGVLLRFAFFSTLALDFNPEFSPGNSASN